MLVYRARCCNPIRGESIVATSHGQGSGGTRGELPHVTNLMYEPEAPDRCGVGRDENTPTAYP